MWQIIALIISVFIIIVLMRISLVRTIFDKLVILDVANTLVITLLITLAIAWQEFFLIDVAIVYAFLSFVGLIYFVKYVR
jgi:multicomponent Na+:H+ antiporter subunit F